MPDWVKTLLQDRTAIVAAAVLTLFTAMAIFAPLVAPHAPGALNGPPLTGPSTSHPLGTDELGRDLLSRILHGARTSLWFGFVATTLAMIVGVPWGLASGYAGGILDTVSMRLMDALLAFPTIILAMAVVAALGPTPRNVMIAVGVVQVPLFSRLIRAEVLTLKSRDYVTAARSFGGSDGFIVWNAIFPNVAPLVAVQFALGFATAVLTEASLSYLGLGVQPPTPSWGSMLQTSRGFMLQNPGYSIFTGVAIFVTIMMLSLLGDALRDAHDPRRGQQLTGGTGI